MSATLGVAARTMRAAVIDAPGSCEVQRRPVREPGPGEVAVRIEGCGVCASSVPLWEGRPWFQYPLEPGAPGHEAWGVDVATGRRVALISYHAFAEYDVAPAENVVQLPPQLDDMPFPGEALACAMNVFARSGAGAGDTVAIVGVGFLGLLLVQLCVSAGARTFAVARRRSTLALARTFGAETAAEPPEEGCDVVIETAGAQATLDIAARSCRVRGRLVIAGFHQDGPRTIDLQSWNWRGIDVVNAHEREPERYREGIRAAAAAVVAGRLDPTPLYTHVLPLDTIDIAFELARTRPEGFVKALVIAG